MPDNNSELANSSQEPSRELKAAARCAEILFLLALVLAIATLALNRALSENRREYRTRYEWYEDVGSMLGRLRAFRERSPAFFEGLVLSSLTLWPARDTTRYPSIAGLVADGPVIFSRRPDDGSISQFGGPSADYTLLSELMNSAKKFGELAARIVADEPDPARRRPLLNAAVATRFGNEEARKLLQTTAVESLSRIDSASEWPGHTRSMWIVFGEWPLIGTTIHGTPLPGTTYTGRFLVPADADSEKDFLYRDLGGMTDLAESESTLVALWREAYARVKDFPTGDPQIALPGGSMSLLATDIVMLGGPLLVILQAFFALFWIRHWKLQPKVHEARTPFMFPTFESPVDPLDAPIPRSMDDVTQRVAWILFLIIPAFVLSFAIVTRYDLSVFTTDWLPRGIPWVARILDQRRYDGFSVLMDIINIVSLLFSIMLMVQITTSNRAPTTARGGRRFVRRMVLVTALLLCLSVGLWSGIGKADASVGHINLADLLYWVSFGLTWLIAMIVSFSCRARLVFVLSLIGMVFVIAMFAPSTSFKGGGTWDRAPYREVSAPTAYDR